MSQTPGKVFTGIKEQLNEPTLLIWSGLMASHRKTQDLPIDNSTGWKKKSKQFLSLIEHDDTLFLFTEFTLEDFL